MLGFLTLCLKGIRIMMFQLSGFYCRLSDVGVRVSGLEFFSKGLGFSG